MGRVVVLATLKGYRFKVDSVSLYEAEFWTADLMVYPRTKKIFNFFLSRLLSLPNSTVGESAGVHVFWNQTDKCEHFTSIKKSKLLDED